MKGREKGRTKGKCGKKSLGEEDYHHDRKNT